MGHKRIDRMLEPAARALSKRVLPFYRRFPYEGNCSLFKADPRGAYSPADSMFYNRIPKAANTTMTEALAKRSAFRRKFSKDDPKDYFLRPSYLSAASVRNLVDNCFKFTILRDPYSRTLSAFSSKIVPGKRQKWQTTLFEDWVRRTGTQEPDFTAFCRFLDDGGLYLDVHWAPQTDFLLLPLEMFDFVGRVETFDADMAHVLRTVFGEDTGVETRRAGKRTDADARLAAAYTPEALEIVNRLYAKDFERLGYPRRDGF